MLKKILLISIGILIPFSVAFAAWNLEVDWPPSPMGTDLYTGSTLTDLTRYFYEWGIALGGLAAFIALLIAGFQYLTSVGDPQKMADARGRIVWALAGLVLLLASWLILNTINPDLTTLTPPSFNPAGAFSTCDAEFKTDTARGSCPGGQTCCQPGYRCGGDPNPGDGKKEGICINYPEKEEKPACSYARPYAKKDWFDFMPDDKIINIDEVKKFTGPYPHSIKSFYDDTNVNVFCASITDDTECRLKRPDCDWNTSSNKCTGFCASATTDTDCAGKWDCNWNSNTSPSHCYRDCGEDACGCTAKLWEGAVFQGWTCGDESGKVSAADKNLYRWRLDPEEDITCVELIAP